MSRTRIFVLFPIVCLVFVLNLINCDEIIEQRLGTRTPYRAIDKNEIYDFKETSCTPLKSWSYYRHGTRLPSAKMMKEMRKVLPRVRKSILKSSKHHLTPEEIALFENWEPILVPNDEENFLTLEGEGEMFRLGFNYRGTFSDILPMTFSNLTVKIKYAPSQRTTQSARFFTFGLFNKDISNDTSYPDPIDSFDPVLRFYKNCTYIKNHVKNNPETYKSYNAYIESSEVTDAMKKISWKLGLNVSFDTANLMYKACGYETAMSKFQISPWCYAFPDKTIEILENAFDIRYYWLHSYGFPITRKISCSAIEDMLQFLKTKEGPKVALHFSHSGAFIKILAFMNLFKPNAPLGPGNMDPLRTYRTSLIDGFSSNIGFVLVKCEDGEQKVMFLHQEHPIPIPMCDDLIICPYEKFMKNFESQVEFCDLKKLCTDSIHDEL